MPRDLLAELNSDNPFTSSSNSNPFGTNNDNPFGTPAQSNATGNSNPFGTSSNNQNPFGDVENPAQSAAKPDPADEYLASLQTKLWEESSSEEEPVLNFNESGERFEELNGNIDKIQELTSRINKKVREYEEMTNQKEMNDMHRRITNDFAESRDLSSKVAIQLKNLRMDIFDSVKKGTAGDGTRLQWQRNQFQLCKSRYETVLKDYLDADETFRTVKENRTRRLAQTMDVELTQEEVEECVRDPMQAQKMLEQQLASDALLENLAHLEETRDAMKSIEQGVHDILEMWKDFNAILEIQQEQIDSIEANIVRAHVKVKKGVEYLEAGDQYQQKARKNQCILIACCAIGLLILISGLGFGLS